MISATSLFERLPSSKVTTRSAFFRKSGESRMAGTCRLSHWSPVATGQSCMSLQRFGVMNTRFGRVPGRKILRELGEGDHVLGAAVRIRGDVRVVEERDVLHRVRPGAGGVARPGHVLAVDAPGAA